MGQGTDSPEKEPVCTPGTGERPTRVPGDCKWQKQTGIRRVLCSKAPNSGPSGAFKRARLSLSVARPQPHAVSTSNGALWPIPL